MRVMEILSRFGGKGALEAWSLAAQADDFVPYMMRAFECSAEEVTEYYENFLFKVKTEGDDFTMVPCWQCGASYGVQPELHRCEPSRRRNSHEPPRHAY